MKEREERWQGGGGRETWRERGRSVKALLDSKNNANKEKAAPPPFPPSTSLLNRCPPSTQLGSQSSTLTHHLPRSQEGAWHILSLVLNIRKRFIALEWSQFLFLSPLLSTWP